MSFFEIFAEGLIHSLIYGKAADILIMRMVFEAIKPLKRGMDIQYDE